MVLVCDGVTYVGDMEIPEHAVEAFQKRAEKPCATQSDVRRAWKKGIAIESATVEGKDLMYVGADDIILVKRGDTLKTVLNARWEEYQRRDEDRLCSNCQLKLGGWNNCPRCGHKNPFDG